MVDSQCEWETLCSDIGSCWEWRTGFWVLPRKCLDGGAIPKTPHIRGLRVSINLNVAAQGPSGVS